MEIRALAERALFGQTLADKLAGPAPGEPLTDRAPGPATAIPAAPGRPDALRFSDARAPFPQDLADPLARAAVLHFFANHELLAIELMALLLLRRPDAPPEMRAGIARTLIEEQSHLRLYRDRMEALGGGFGQIPVSRFFWDCLSRSDDPRAFFAGMSLTFEQANLDYCLHYAARLREVGDEETAEILDRVYADEIGHVRHGLGWTRRLTPGREDWDAWVEALPPPLTPDRARGLGFSREARAAAGLDAAFVRRLALYRHSRGRPPVVWWMNPSCEDEIAGRAPDRVARQIQRDLEALPLLLAGRDDAVALSREPSPIWLESLDAAGVPLAQRLVAADPDALQASLADRKLSGLSPWGWSPAADRWLGPLRGQVVAGAGADRSAAWDPRWRALHDKGPWAAICRELLEALDGPLGPPEIAGALAADRAELDAIAADLRARGWGRLVAKAPLGAAGRGAIRLDGPPDPRQSGWLERVWRAQGPVLVAPWLARRVDLSIHLDALPGGGHRLRGVVRFFTDDRGGFLGALVGQPLQGLPSTLLRPLSSGGRDPRWLQRIAGAVAARVGAAAAAADYVGPIGIDAMIYEGPDGEPRLHPLLEVNPRWTMGRLSLALRQRVAPRRVGVWAILRDREVGAPAAWASSRAPPERAPRGRVSGGVLFTTDPASAGALVTALAIAEDEAACWSLLRG